MPGAVAARERPLVLVDANDSFFKDGGSPKETKEAALDDAAFMAKSGRVFVHQLAEIDRELKP